VTSRNSPAPVLCLDIGNTHVHHGILNGGNARTTGEISSRALREGDTAPAAVLIETALREHGAAGLAFCSVVPRATERLRAVLARFPALPVHHLRHDNCPGLGINYPAPSEIGQDRLANCIGAQVVASAPAIILDMGTAVTFDILSSEGYEGGIIAPGLGVMTNYLHEQTALLPALDPAGLLGATGVGKSTVEAMRIGCAVGFAGMLDALLEMLLAEMGKVRAGTPALLATGGSAGALPATWGARLRWIPELTLIGLEEAFRRATGGKSAA